MSMCRSLKTGLLSTLFASSIFGALPTDPHQAVVAYFENWAQYRNANGVGVPPSCFPVSLSQFSGSNGIKLCNMIDVLNYAFLFFNVDVSGGQVVPNNDWLVYPTEWNDVSTLFPQARALKAINPSLKLMMSIGGWSFNDPATRYGAVTQTFFSQVVADNPAGSRAAFISSLVSSCNIYGFDGVDLDWEYPGQTARGGNSGDFQSFLTFLGLLNMALKHNSPPLYLSMAVPPFFPNGTVTGGTYIGASYPSPITFPAYSGGTVTDEQSYFVWFGKAAKYCDWINVMSYDYNGAWDAQTAHNAPFNGVSPQEYVTQSIFLWTDPAYGNVPASWVTMGIPAYARTFSNVDFSSGNFGPGKNFKNPGPAGKYTQQPGVLAYFEYVYQNNLTLVYDTAAGTSYAYLNPPVASNIPSLWETVDTPDGTSVTSSVRLKANYVRTQQIVNSNFPTDTKLGGAMMYAISQDYYWVDPAKVPNGAPVLTTIYNTLHPEVSAQIPQRNNNSQ